MKPLYHQIQRYLDYCENVRNMSSTTLCAKRSVYRRFAETVPCGDLRSLTNADFNVWVKHEVTRGVSPRTINTYNANILAMVAYYREMGLAIPLKIPLVQKLKEGPTRRDYYTATQITQVLDYADPVSALMIKICFDSGLRIAELTKLRLKNFHGARINFVGKGNKPREVYLSDATKRALQNYIDDYQIEDYLWPSQQTGTHLAINSIRKRLKKIFEQAGYNDFYPHALRHSFATDLQARGASVEEIQQMIGHANISTTERYLHALDGHLAELFAKYR